VTDDEKIARQLHERWGPLAAASRARLEPDQHTKEQILQRILREPRQPRRRRRGWPARSQTLWLGGAAAAIATAAVTAVIVVLAWPQEPVPALAATPPSLDYQAGPPVPVTRLLNEIAGAAQATGQPGAGPVEFIHFETWDLNARIDNQHVTTAVVPSHQQLWRKPDDAATVIARYGTPWFPDDVARRAWEADGSPGSDTAPRRTDDPPGGHTWLWADRPPTNPSLLQSWLRQNHNIVDTGGYFTAVVDLLKERVLTGPERAAVLRLLATLPNIDYTGTVKDRAGRPGEAFSTTSTAGGLPARHTLILDRTSGRILAYERTLTTTSGGLNVRIPAVTSYVVFHGARFTTAAP
jgi:hypothetical protein